MLVPLKVDQNCGGGVVARMTDRDINPYVSGLTPTGEAAVQDYQRAAVRPMTKLEIREAEGGEPGDPFDCLDEGFLGAEQSGKGRERRTLLTAIAALVRGEESGTIE
jgi:hypothetical protein